MFILYHDIDHPESQDNNSELLLINHINKCGLLFFFFQFYTIDDQHNPVLVFSSFLKRQVSVLHDLCTVQVDI